MLASVDPFVRVAGLAKRYAGGVTAVGDVTFDVMPGELVSLVGPSGCGKSTLLKVIAGLLPADAGRLEFGAPGFDPGRDIGMGFQQPLLLGWRTVLDNVLLPAEILGLPVAAARARARELLALVGLSGWEDRYPHALSGGMQQRVSLARALVHDPKLVLLDEPFGALDALTRERMGLELRRLWAASGKTVLLVTHGVQEAVFLGSRVVVLTAGPARMADAFAVSLPEPRTLAVRSTAEFGAYAARIYRHLGVAEGGNG